MSNFEQREGSKSVEQRENVAPNLADTLHLLDCSHTNGVFNHQSEMTVGMNSNNELLAQLAGTSTPHEGQRRSLSGLPMTEGGQPAEPQTDEQMNARMDSARRYWADLIPPS